MLWPQAAQAMSRQLLGHEDPRDEEKTRNRLRIGFYSVYFSNLKISTRKSLSSTVILLSKINQLGPRSQFSLIEVDWYWNWYDAFFASEISNYIEWDSFPFWYQMKWQCALPCWCFLIPNEFPILNLSWRQWEKELVKEAVSWLNRDIEMRIHNLVSHKTQHLYSENDKYSDEEKRTKWKKKGGENGWCCVSKYVTGNSFLVFSGVKET